MTRFGRIAVAVLAITACRGIEAANIYVSQNGSDVNSGSSSAPFRTITKGASMAKPGDTVVVGAGTYNEIVKIGVSGTASARIRIQGEPGAIIDGTGSAAGTNLVQISSAAYVDFTGFEVRNATRIGICLWGTNNVRVANNNVHHSQKGGIYVGYSAFGSAFDNTIEANSVSNNVLENQYHATSGGWSQSIGANYTDRTRIIGNKVFKNDGEGIVFVMSDGGFAQGNEVFDNFSVEMYLDNAQSTTLDSNFIYNTGDTRYYRNGLPADGIGMANEAYATTNPLSDNTITNNIVLLSRWGIYYGNYENGGGLRNTLVANNTFYGSTAALVHVDNTTHSGSTFQNNIFYAANGGGLADVQGGGITYRNNAWYGGSAGAASGSGDVIGDPKLVRAGGVAPADYKLTSSSPALQRGVTITSLSRDYFGAARGGMIDLGAHQLSLGSGATPADTTAPAAPANVTATVTGSTSVSLTWSAASDNVGVTAYRVLRNGVVIATVNGTAFSDSGLAAATTYRYEVRAIDAAGNVSASSNVASVTTSAKTRRKTVSAA